MAEPAQAAVIASLIRYYQTGEYADLLAFDAAWVQNDAPVDFINGFIEIYRDTAGAKGSSQSFVTITDGPQTRAMTKLAENAAYFEAKAPWADAYKKKDFRPPVVKAVEVLIETGDFEDYWTSALVFASAARCAAHQGDIPAAHKFVKRVARLRPLLTYALPVVSAQTLLELAHAYIALGDPTGARAVLQQSGEIFQQRPDLGTLPAASEQLWSKVRHFTGTAVGASSLTAAELRLVPLLATHLSFPEIGERLFVSRNTVKTEALSIYRKLGVSSRAAAVNRMGQLGLFTS